MQCVLWELNTKMGSAGTMYAGVFALVPSLCVAQRKLPGNIDWSTESHVSRWSAGRLFNGSIQGWHWSVEIFLWSGHSQGSSIAPLFLLSAGTPRFLDSSYIPRKGPKELYYLEKNIHEVFYILIRRNIYNNVGGWRKSLALNYEGCFNLVWGVCLL